MHPVRWIGWAGVAVAWGGLAFLNVVAALNINVRPEMQYVFGVSAFIIDLCAIAFAVIVREENSAGRPFGAITAAAVWAVCCLVEVYGAHSALITYTGENTAPSRQAEELRQLATKDLEAERGNLANIRSKLDGERKKSVVDGLRKRETASLKRIDELTPKTLSTASAAQPHDMYTGREFLFVVVLWLASQLAVFALTGDIHGGAGGEVEEVPAAWIRRPTRRMEEGDDRDDWDAAQVIGGNQPAQPTNLGCQPTGLELGYDAGGATKPLTTEQPSNQPATNPETNLDRPGGVGGQPHGSKGEKLVSQPTAPLVKPRLALVADNQPTSQQPTKGKLTFEDRVADLVAAGCSQNEIARRLKVGRQAVRTALNKIKEQEAEGKGSASS